MKKIFTIVVMVMASHVAWTDTGGGQGVGSGGDALRELFDEAALGAVGRLNNIGWCSFSSSTDPAVSKFILDNTANYINEIQNSPRNWSVDSQPTCGYTDHSSLAPVYFSYPTCAATVGTDMNAAMFTLLHEMSHHLGIDDEKQADAMAQGILDADISHACPPPVADPFDASICQGPVFSSADAAKYILSGTSQATIGKYQIYVRTRQCNHLNGCQPWVSDTLDFFNGYIYGATGASVMLTTTAQAPYFTAALSINFGSLGDQVLVSGVPGSLSWYDTTGLTSAITYRYYSSYITNSDYAGELHESCGWFHGHKVSPDLANGIYYEAEFVIYGTQQP